MALCYRARCSSIEDIWDEVVDAIFWSHMDRLDEYDLTQCLGICGQTVRQCRCDEIYLQEGHGNDSHLSLADVRELTEPTESQPRAPGLKKPSALPLGQFPKFINPQGLWILATDYATINSSSTIKC